MIGHLGDKPESLRSFLSLGLIKDKREMKMESKQPTEAQIKEQREKKYLQIITYLNQNVGKP